MLSTEGGWPRARARPHAIAVIGALLLAVGSALDAQPSLERAERLEAEAKRALEDGSASQAEDLLQQAVSAREEAGDDGKALVEDVRLLGCLARMRGDVERAEARYRRVLAYEERAGSATIVLARTLEVLGNLALQRVDIAAARTIFERALAFHGRIGTPADEWDVALNHPRRRIRQWDTTRGASPLPGAARRWPLRIVRR